MLIIAEIVGFAVVGGALGWGGYEPDRRDRHRGWPVAELIAGAFWWVFVPWLVYSMTSDYVARRWLGRRDS